MFVLLPIKFAQAEKGNAKVFANEMNDAIMWPTPRRVS